MSERICDFGPLVKNSKRQITCPPAFWKRREREECHLCPKIVRKVEADFIELEHGEKRRQVSLERRETMRGRFSL